MTEAETFFELTYGRPRSNTWDDVSDWIQTLPDPVVDQVYDAVFQNAPVGSAAYRPRHFKLSSIMICLTTEKVCPRVFDIIGERP